MGQVIYGQFHHQKEDTTPTLTGKIGAAAEPVRRDLAVSHTAEALKDIEDIYKIEDHLLAHNRYRDYMLIALGINFGLRIGDLLTLRFCDLISDDLTFRDSFQLLEQKTRSTRRVPRNRTITVNDAVRDAVTLYLEHTSNVKLDDYLFRSESSNASGENKPISRQAVDLILKGLSADLGLTAHFSSHSLRKTFGYHQLASANNDPRRLILLQKIFGHSDLNKTLRYIGLDDEEIGDAYRTLNLGRRHNHRTSDSAPVVITGEAVQA